MNDNQKPLVLGRPKGTLHLDSARLIRERAMQTQERVEAAPKTYDELRQATDLVPPSDPI